jgi:hypothetical protein
MTSREIGAIQDRISGGQAEFEEKIMDTLDKQLNDMTPKFKQQT